MLCLLLLLILSAVIVFLNSCLCVCFAGREAEGMDMGQVLYSHGVFLAIIRGGVVTMFAGGGGGGEVMRCQVLYSHGVFLAMVRVSVDDVFPA